MIGELRFSLLSSGSRANCTFVEMAGQRFLIDCGLSAKQAEVRLLRLGISPASLEGIVISHEHRDHIQGVSVLSRKFSLPVYVSRGTSEFLSNVYAIEEIEAGETFSIGAVEVTPFQVVHDAVDPLAFVVRGGGLKFGQATDLGKVTPLVRDSLRDCDGLVIESNHDDEMLRECEYPWVLKQRISSSHGHLSNSACGELLRELAHPMLQCIVLAHLSENSNTPELALTGANQALEEFQVAGYLPKILCGSPRGEIPLLTLHADGEALRASVV